MKSVNDNDPGRFNIWPEAAGQMGVDCRILIESGVSKRAAIFIREISQLMPHDAPDPVICFDTTEFPPDYHSMHVPESLPELRTKLLYRLEPLQRFTHEQQAQYRAGAFDHQALQFLQAQATINISPDTHLRLSDTDNAIRAKLKAMDVIDAKGRRPFKNFWFEATPPPSFKKNRLGPDVTIKAIHFTVSKGELSSSLQELMREVGLHSITTTLDPDIRIAEQALRRLKFMIELGRPASDRSP